MASDHRSCIGGTAVTAQNSDWVCVPKSAGFLTFRCLPIQLLAPNAIVVIDARHGRNCKNYGLSFEIKELGAVISIPLQVLAAGQAVIIGLAVPPRVATH